MESKKQKPLELRWIKLDLKYNCGVIGCLNCHLLHISHSVSLIRWFNRSSPIFNVFFSDAHAEHKHTHARTQLRDIFDL